MATVAAYKPVAGHTSLPRRLSRNQRKSTPLCLWNQNLYADPALRGSQPCDLIDTSRDLPNPLPWSISNCVLSSPEPIVDPKLAPSFLFRNYDNLIGDWDDSSDSKVSLSPEMNLVELQVAQSISNEQDESAPLEDSMDDEPIIQSPQSLQESDIPPREGLYSTPLSWERPKLDCRVGNLLQFEPLSPEEESRLLAIAMPAQSPPMTPPLSPSHAPERTHSSRKRESRKRRSSKKSSQRSASASSTAPHAARPFSSHTTAHNIVEKRYRTNLNLKIAALRDSVPSLRVLDQNNPCNVDSKDDLQGLSAAHKHNRSTILSKAVEYITDLEKQIKFLRQENEALSSAMTPSRYLYQ